MRRLPTKFTARSAENFYAELHLAEICQVSSPSEGFFLQFFLNSALYEKEDNTKDIT